MAEYYSWRYQEQYHWHIPWCKKDRSALFFGEQEYRFNHRNTGKQIMDKVAKYISKSHPMTCKQITNALNAAFPIFAQ